MNFTMARLAVSILLVGSVSGHAAPPVTSWNPYDDFYLSPATAGWGGATSPSSAGSSWGYYMGNVNGFGFPLQIGSYFTPDQSGSGSQSMYSYSSQSPLGSASLLGLSLWDPTGGAGFARYTDNQGWGSSLGRYDNAWFSGAPAMNNAMWMQSGWLGGGASEGIAPVLTWTAPSTGTYSLVGQFLAGAQGANGASVAIVDSLGTSLLARTTLASSEASSFSFTKTYNAGDVVQFQVGSNFTTGNAVGLQTTINQIPEPSSVALLTAGLAAFGLTRAFRREA